MLSVAVGDVHVTTLEVLPSGIVYEDDWGQLLIIGDMLSTVETAQNGYKRY